MIPTNEERKTDHIPLIYATTEIKLLTVTEPNMWHGHLRFAISTISTSLLLTDIFFKETGVNCCKVADGFILHAVISHDKTDIIKQYIIHQLRYVSDSFKEQISGQPLETLHW